VQQLGARPEEMIDAAGIVDIRNAAERDETTRFWQSAAVAAVGGAALWIAVMFVLGAVLAASIPRVPKSVELTGRAQSRREVWLERFYLLVLSLGLVAFYASVPVVALGLLAVTLAVFGLLLVIRIIHFGVLHRGLWATWNILRCALIGPRSGVLGIEATGDKHPRLFEALRAVADRLQTRPVDTVYLTPSSNISVHQEGSGPFGLLGKRQRVLTIGISTLPLLSRDEFHSILAHEYGHFTHKDPLYSRFIFQVSASLTTSLAVMNAAGGVLNYINPFYWFWWLYLRAYTLLASGFSRSREFLADRRATAAYGKQAFISGLTKVSVDGVLFESTIYTNVRYLLGQGKAFTNAFDAFRQFREGADMVESRQRLLEQMRQTRPKWFDSHPTFSERLAAVAEFPDAATPPESDSAIELLSDYPAVEAELTEMLTYYINQGS
jgi:Zn-dependent protease with chaperone function